MKSRDDVQLLAASMDDLKNPKSDCRPYDFVADQPIAPCGAIANSLFNDTFFLYDDEELPDDDALFDLVRNPAADGNNRIAMSGENIAWQTDKVISKFFSFHPLDLKFSPRFSGMTSSQSPDIKVEN